MMATGTEGTTAAAEEASRQTGDGDGTTGHVGVGIATTGDIRAVGVLDLLHVTPEDLERTTSIGDVGTVLVRESMAGRLSAIPMHKVGSVVAVPDGGRLVTNMGVVKLPGEALAASGHEDEVLLVVGPLVITTPVERVAYRRLVVVGVLVAPKGSEAALASVALTGVSTFYSLGAAPRTVIGEESWSREFFEELPEPVTLVVVGAVTVEPGVTRDLLREKVSSIALVGTLRAPKELVPILQVLSPDKVGEISVLEPDEPDELAGG
jgi:hypothetical protein